MIQYIIISVFFLAALGFMGRRIWKAFDKSDSGCAKGCGCATDTIKA